MGNSPPRSPKRRQAWPQTVIEIPSGTKVARRRAVPTAPVPSLPNEPRFAPSFNGRNGWRFEKVYNVGDAVCACEMYVRDVSCQSTSKSAASSLII